MGSSFNTILAIYTGTTLPQLIRVASNDDSDGGTASRVSFPVTAGVSYPIAVDGVGKAKGNIALHLALTPSQPPVIVTQPLSKVVPDAGSVTFAVDAIGTAPLQYQWRKDGSNIINAAQSSYTIASVSPTSAGAYSVVVSNSEGTTVSSNAVLEILLLKPQISIQPTSTTTYLGGSFQLFVVATGSSPLSYQWRKEGTNIVAATNSLYRVDRAQPNQEGAYKVVVSNSQGSVTSQVAVLTFVAESAPVIARTTFANGLIELAVQFLSLGRAYEIQTSDDLTGSTWVPGLRLLATTSSFVVSFPLGANTSKRFFRVRDLTSGLYSSNTVGILNQTALGNYSLNFIGNPLRRSSGSTLNELFSSSDTDSTFYKLGSTSGGTYEYSDTFSSPSSPAWDPDLSFNPGEGGILVVGNEQPVTMVGEVMQGSVTNILPAGRSLCSSILPVNGLVGFPSVKGDVVHRMNPSTGSFDTYSYNGTSWSPGTPPVLAGESFWVDLSSARTWVQQLDLGGTPSHYSITRQAYTGGPTDWVP